MSPRQVRRRADLLTWTTDRFNGKTAHSTCRPQQGPPSLAVLLPSLPDFEAGMTARVGTVVLGDVRPFALPARRGLGRGASVGHEFD
jgi:hypothetical protein